MIEVPKATSAIYKVAFRRRRLNLTNYSKRLSLVKGALPRMVVRKSSRGVLVQFISFSPKGDQVLACAASGSLKEYGWVPHCNSPTAYLCGLLAGKNAAAKGLKEFNLDIGMHTPSKGSLVFAALKGALDAGLKTNYSEEMISEDRIQGAQIAQFAKKLRSEDESRYKRVFSSYLKENFAPENIVEQFNLVKEKIQRS
ncbi:MAG: 50S ribosomal protein L18 [Candidatus Micrarchaeota archaeon]|nr:50S ribosomal protein L18 [Candidatus Micrarchaeota archaeon]